MSSLRIPESEWRFSQDRVPDSELVPCLLWEFLRESQTVSRLVSEWAKIFAAGEKNLDQRPLRSRMEALKVRLNAPIRLSDFINHAVLTRGFNRGIDLPWQHLAADAKKNLILTSTANPPVFVGYDLHASLLEQALRRKDDGTALLQAKAMMPGWDNGKQLTLLVIDWGRYDDASIRAALQSLANDLKRPEGIEPQVQKASGLGRRTEWRGKLNDLGAARLSARYSAVQLRTDMPVAFREFASKLSDRGPTALEKKLAAARRRFEASFHKLLPFEKQAPRCLAASRFTK
jgi:hypothetical protein